MLCFYIEKEFASIFQKIFRIVVHIHKGNMTNIKLNGLTIFLLLLAVIVFAMVFKSSWDAMLQTKEGFTSSGSAETGVLTDNSIFQEVLTGTNADLYFYLPDKSLVEVTRDTTDGSETRVVFGRNGKVKETVDANTDYVPDAFVLKVEDALVLYVPYEDATFIHVIDDTKKQNRVSQYYNGSSKSQKTYSGTTIVNKDGISVSDLDFGMINYSDQDNSNGIQTSVFIITGPVYVVAMKHLNVEVLVAFSETTDAQPSGYQIQKFNQQSGNTGGDNGSSSTGISSGSSSGSSSSSSSSDSGSGSSSGSSSSSGSGNSLKIKFGDYEIDLPQKTAEDLAESLGKRLGGALFMNQDDYNNETIYKTQVVPGFGYDHYAYDNYGRLRGGRGYGGYYDSDVYNERRDGPRDENGNLLSDFGEGTANLLRDGAKGGAELARETAQGTVGLAKETAQGTIGLAKETVGGATGLAKETVSGTKDVAYDAVGGATNLASSAASGAVDAAGNTLSGTGNFIQSSASGIGQFAKDAAGGVVGLGKDVVGGTVGLGREIVGGVASMGQNRGQGGGYAGGQGGSHMGGYQNSYAGPNMRPTHGMDPYSYHGSVPPRPSCNFIPRTADFSAFGR